MKKGAKVALGVGCGVLVFGAIVVIVAGYFGLNYIESRLDESVKKFEIEGREFGKTTDTKGCVDQGVHRSASVELLDMSGGIALGAFVDACLETSRPTDNFCEGVPSFWSMRDSEWAAAECTTAGLDSKKTACVHVLKRKHEFCSRNQ